MFISYKKKYLFHFNWLSKIKQTKADVLFVTILFIQDTFYKKIKLNCTSLFTYHEFLSFLAMFIYIVDLFTK